MARFRKTSKSKLLKRGGKSVKKRGKTLKKKGKSVKKRMGKYNKNKRGKRRNTLKRGGFFGMFGGPPESFNYVAYNTYHYKEFNLNNDGYYIHNDYPGYKYSRISNGSDSVADAETYNYTLIGPVQ